MSTVRSTDFTRFLQHLEVCPRCGGSITKDNNLIKCEGCSLHLYVNPVITTGAVLLNEDDEILLVRRRVDPKKGYWDTPGGFVDLGENLEDSLRRELKEELGITIDELAYLTSKSDEYLYRDVYYQTLGTIFQGRIKKTQVITVSDDVDGYEFFSKENFPHDKLAFNSLTEFFREYLSR